MKTRSKFFLSVTALSLLLLIGIPVVSAGPASKVDVCHLDADTGIFHMINISENALQAHVDHGDGLPGDSVPGMEGYIFGPDCSLELANVERAALIALYNSTNGDSWTNKWDTTTDHCTWRGVGWGVGCDGSGNVIALYLHSNNLVGSIPPELGNLSNLKSLSLSSNQLSGSIPPELGNLSNLLYLSLSSNQLSGSIPPELGNLSNLQTLDLYNNQLSGPIPLQLGNLSNLVGFLLGNNQLSGPIPPELGNLSNLGNLDLSNNQLSGSIPPELGNLSNLLYLQLHYNQLSGPIPAELSNLTNLYLLLLDGNPALVCWETQAALSWAQGLLYYYGPDVVCPS